MRVFCVEDGIGQGVGRAGRMCLGLVTALLVTVFFLGHAVAADDAGPDAGPKASVRVEATGRAGLRVAGKELLSIQAGGFTTEWRGLSARPMLEVKRGEGSPTPFQITAGEAVIAGSVAAKGKGNKVLLSYGLTPDRAVQLNSLHVSLDGSTADWRGMAWKADGVTGTLPERLGAAQLFVGQVQTVELSRPDGLVLRVAFEAPTGVLLQDNRQWGGETFSLRVMLPAATGNRYAAGVRRALEIGLQVASGLSLEVDGPRTMAADTEWLGLQEDGLEIEAGSALDWSGAAMGRGAGEAVPAGALGRLMVRPDGHFAFAEAPGERVRFYGVNLCFSANFLDHGTADRLALRLQRLGYNAVRLHHQDGGMVAKGAGTGKKAGEVVLDAEAMDRLDYLVAALAKRGIYVTTDLFVSRQVSWRDVGIDRDGNMEGDEFKVRLAVDERAMANWEAFATAWLGHKNPYRDGVRWADDPALLWLSLVNEGNFANYYGRIRGIREWQDVWLEWKLANGVPQVPGRSMPLPEGLYGTGTEDALLWRFLNDMEGIMVGRMRRILAEKTSYRGLLTNANGWTARAATQGARQMYDLVDNHFYVGHPHFLERPWRLPSGIEGANPLADGGAFDGALPLTRVHGKPYVITESNFAYPGHDRSMSGLLTGARAALQDWDAVFRFAYAHNREAVAGPRPAGYFDLASDPLNLAADRAAIALFLRGDLAAAEHRVTLMLSGADLQTAEAGREDLRPAWRHLAWVTALGGGFADGNALAALRDVPPPTRARELVVPAAWATGLDVYQHWLGERGAGHLRLGPALAEATSASVLARLKETGMLPAKNRTHPAKGRYMSETGELLLDSRALTLQVDTPRMLGGTGPAGTTLDFGDRGTLFLGDAAATVTVMSVDGKPIGESRRLLITHLTDLQNTGARFANSDATILLDHGTLPHLVRRGSVMMSLKLAEKEGWQLWGLSTSGKRLARVPLVSEVGNQSAWLNTDFGEHGAVFYHELVRPE